MQTLATLVVGEKAVRAQTEEAEAAAEAKRAEENAKIGGSTQTGGGGGPNSQPERRGVADWRDKNAVGAAYKFGATE